MTSTYRWSFWIIDWANNRRKTTQISKVRCPWTAVSADYTR